MYPDPCGLDGIALMDNIVTEKYRAHNMCMRALTPPSRSIYLFSV